jgi:hypothetical protein
LEPSSCTAGRFFFFAGALAGTFFNLWLQATTASLATPVEEVLCADAQREERGGWSSPDHVTFTSSSTWTTNITAKSSSLLLETVLVLTDCISVFRGLYMGVVWCSWL